ncbi:MAG: SIS domain-containing protein [Chloroflexi bacterium]|nr:SIS domain-containing protein [Chloroflexota bacterium]
MSQSKNEIIRTYFAEVSQTLDRLPIDTIAEVVEAIENARINGKQVFLFGNGGSAATASHFACDLSKGGIVEGKPRIKAISLCDNLSLMTAWGNDTAYEHIFAEQLVNLVQPGDVVIGISGSGNSPNVLNGMKVAREKGARTIGFGGFDGGKLKDMVDIPLVVANNCMEQVEDFHLLLEHAITTCLREMEI